MTPPTPWHGTGRTARPARTARPPRPARRAPALVALVALVVPVVLAGCAAQEPAPTTSAGPSGPAAPSSPASSGPSSSTGTSSSSPSAPSTSAPTSTPSRIPTRPPASRIRPVPPAQWRAMQEAGMVRPECPVQERAELRRVDLNYVDFSGRTQRGHLVVRDDTAASTRRIFDRLYAERFPIRRMQGVEAYDGDVARSLRADNTSAYNCRRADQINAPFAQSPHANGRAIDVNPAENPWVDLRCDCWTPSAKHAARTPGKGKVLEGGLVWRLFTDEGWVWQNIKVPDYMHFDTGYPSRPLPGS